MAHKNSLYEGITTRRETNSLDYCHKRGIIFNKHLDRYTGTVDWEAQSCSTFNHTSTILLKPDMSLTEDRGRMGTATTPTMASNRSPTMNKIPPTCHHQGGTNQQQSICQTIINSMVKRLWILYWGLQWQWPSMVMDNSFSMTWETHVDPPIILSISSDHIHDYPTNETGVTYLGIHRQFQRTWLDAKVIIQPSERKIIWCSIRLAWVETHQ